MRLKIIQNLVCLFIFFVLSTVASAGSTRINGNNAPFLYESRAEIRTLDSKLAGYISVDYRNARDEFTKHDLMQQIKPVIEKRINAAKTTKNVLLLVGGNLGNYDFNDNAFPTGFSETSFIPFDNGYAVTFTNGDQMKMLPVSMEHARTLSESLRNNRNATFSVYGEIVGIKEKKLNWNTNKTIEVKINSFEVKLKSGVTVGRKTF